MGKITGISWADSALGIVDRYLVHFIGDAQGQNVERIVVNG